jgi:hypothetical protein
MTKHRVRGGWDELCHGLERGIQQYTGYPPGFSEEAATGGIRALVAEAGEFQCP